MAHLGKKKRSAPEANSYAQGKRDPEIVHASGGRTASQAFDPKYGQAGFAAENKGESFAASPNPKRQSWTAPGVRRAIPFHIGGPWIARQVRDPEAPSEGQLGEEILRAGMDPEEFSR